MIGKTYQFLNGLGHILVQKGVDEVVLSPGNRNAPLALNFMRNERLRYFVINDERSAAYFALGRSLQGRKPVVLVCTSGTAAANYYPAIVEAYFQRVPLLVFTADRPREYYEQNYNQVINQVDMFRNHCTYSGNIDLTIYDETKQGKDYLQINEGVNKSKLEQRPVHFNFHLNDELYPGTPITLNNERIKLVDQKSSVPRLSKQDFDEQLTEMIQYRRILILGGQMPYNRKLRNLIDRLLTLTDITFIRDITANIHSLERAIMHPDEILSNSRDPKELKCDLLITFGNKITSKTVADFLKEYPPKAHWHVSTFDDYFDTYSVLSRIIKSNPEDFIRSVVRNIKHFERKTFEAYYLQWQKADDRMHDLVKKEIERDHELKIIREVLNFIPKNSVLHLGNSLPIRQANKVNLYGNRNARSIEVCSNRGASGIDGCLSTAIGSAFMDERKHYLIIGDQSFIYDRNALWNKYLPQNLTIIIMNNKGGKIFTKIKGPAQQKELDEFFVSHIPFDFEKESIQYGLYFQKTDDAMELGNFLDETKRLNKMAIIEIQTDHNPA